MYPFERFTERAKKVLTLAQEEAERSHHSYIGTEHILLGLMREEEGIAAHVLTNLGVATNTVRSTITSVLGRNERLIIQQIIPTSRVKKVIEISFDEARRMGDKYVGTEHLLLGLLIEGQGIAAHVLIDLGASLEAVRPHIDRLRASGGQGSLTVTRAEWTSSESRRSSGNPLLVGFSREALTAVMGAGALAERAHQTAGSVHLLRAMLNDSECRAVQVLALVGVDAAVVRGRLDAAEASPAPAGPAEVDSDLFRVVQRSFVEAARLGTRRVGTEHLLAALLSAGSGSATHALMDSGCTIDGVRAELGRG